MRHVSRETDIIKIFLILLENIFYYLILIFRVSRETDFQNNQSSMSYV